MSAATDDASAATIAELRRHVRIVESLQESTADEVAGEVAALRGEVAELREGLGRVLEGMAGALRDMAAALKGLSEGQTKQVDRYNTIVETLPKILADVFARAGMVTAAAEPTPTPTPAEPVQRAAKAKPKAVRTRAP